MDFLFPGYRGLLDTFSAIAAEKQIRLTKGL